MSHLICKGEKYKNLSKHVKLITLDKSSLRQ